MELKEGMYIRTKHGIAKIIIVQEINSIGFKEIRYELDKRIIEEDGYLDGRLYNYAYYLEQIIGGPSYQISELIKAGDYVNGFKVTGLDYQYTTKVHRLSCNNEHGQEGFLITPSEIRNIVTKEQFESMEYEVEEMSEEKEEKKNLVDLGFHNNEPIGFKYDNSINKPVLACRFDNYYYAYPTKTGWVFYRSRYLGERDKEIEDISFYNWAYLVLEEVKK